MGAAGELNVGQLVRARWGADSLLVGFTTDHGRVTAASDWGGAAERKHVRPALPGSYERLFHSHELDRFFLPLGRDSGQVLRNARLERAIGVVYRPQTERASHWFHARLPDQFDGVIHFDHTTAVEPLERTSLWDEGEPPETFPTGL
jgi:erythromycin esterase-like protein